MAYTDLDKRRQRRKAWYKDNRERLRAQRRASRAKQHAAIRSAERARYDANREEIIRQRRERYREQADAINAKRRAQREPPTPEQLAYWRTYHQERREHRLQNGRSYRLANHETIRHRESAYQREHPDVARGASKRRRARLLHAPVNDFTEPQWQAMKAHYGHRCVYCGRKMQRLTQDHILPLSKGGSHTQSNIVPACQRCNSRKHVGPPLRPVQPLLL